MSLFTLPCRFDRINEEVAALRSLTRNDLSSFFVARVLTPATRRKLCVRIEGQRAAAAAAAAGTGEAGEVLQLPKEAGAQCCQPGTRDEARSLPTPLQLLRQRAPAALMSPPKRPWGRKPPCQRRWWQQVGLGCQASLRGSCSRRCHRLLCSCDLL